MKFYLAVYSYIKKNKERIEFEEELKKLKRTDSKSYNNQLLLLKDKLSESNIVNVIINQVVFAEDEESVKRLVFEEELKNIQHSCITSIEVFDYTNQALEFAKQQSS